MANGVEFPPLTVVFDGADYWLVDGFHRRWGAIKAKLEKHKCLVIEGTREDARWLSYAANKDHGIRRNSEDKRKAVEAALKHPNGASLSDSQIAEHVGVAVATVGKYRKQLESTFQIEKSKDRSGRDGRTINTTNIGKRQEPAATPEPEPEPQPEPTQEPADFACDHDFDKEACRKCHEPNPNYKPKASEPAKPTFDDSQIINAIHSLSRLLAQRAKAIGGGDGFEACNEEIDDLLKAFSLWQNETNSQAA